MGLDARIRVLLCEALGGSLASVSYRPPRLIKQQNNQISCRLLTWGGSELHLQCLTLEATFWRGEMRALVLADTSTSDGDLVRFIMSRKSAAQTNTKIPLALHKSLVSRNQQELSELKVGKSG